MSQVTAPTFSHAPAGALSGVRVVEIGGGIAAAYSTKLLADLGAEVIKLEPHGGDALRTRGPTPAEGRRLGGGLFQYLNTGKKSVNVDLQDSAERDRVSDLLCGCDLLVESLGPGAWERLGLRSSALALVRISPFGQTGPYHDRPATSLTVQAAGGWAARIGTPEGPPYHAGGRVEEYVAGAYAAAAALSALRQAEHTGEPATVDVSTFECMVGTMPYPMLQKVTFDRLGFPVPQRYQPIPGIMRCADGCVGISALTGQHWADVCTILELPSLAMKMREAALRGAEWQAFLAKAEPWLAARTAAEIVELFQAMRVPAVPIGNGANLPALEPFGSREIYVEQPHAGFLRPRSPFRLSATPAVTLRRTPELGEDTLRILAPDDERSDARASDKRASGARATDARLMQHRATSAWGGGRTGLPFSGLKVLDLTSFWAGPYLTMYLSSLGADVVKVESPRRPDGFRFVAAFPQLGERWWDQSGVYLAANLGKRDVAIDLDHQEGRDLVKRLAAQADVVIESYSPRVIEHFGLGYEALRAVNPAIVMLRMPGFGLSGPCRDWVGWALTFEQLGGCATVTGERDGRMFAPGGFADPVVGMHAAVALQAALVHRDATGQGQLIEIAQIEVVASLTAEQVIRHSIAGELMERNGNRSDDIAPQGIYRCAGTDQWIALSVRNDDDWQRLREALGNPEWTRGPELASVAGRAAGHDDIDARISEWASALDARDTADRLLAAGVPAAALLKTEDIYGDPQLSARGYFQELAHSLCGPMRFPAWPVRFSFLSESYASTAPMLGQHNDEVLGSVLGLTIEERNRLRAAGVIGDTWE